MTAFSLPSFAKLNLALRITGRRKDGFHELVTLFERIDLKDTLTFSPLNTKEIRMTCTHPGVPCDERNLVYKVARLLQEKYHVRQGAKIHIQKRIPVAAGLAGGSSNAATALLGLNRLWGLGLARKELLLLAAKVGSDVAFFLYDASWAIGTGRGEKIKILDLPRNFHHCLVTPRITLLTPEVYGVYRDRFARVRGKTSWAGSVDSLTKVNDDVRILICSLRKSDVKGAGKNLMNDLEPAIITLEPRLKELKTKLLKEEVAGVAFSGSGPSIFALAFTRRAALRLKKKYAPRYAQTFVVKTQ
ncbi:MAG: 4-(cytidine 5'-diphospho)-2-C-methyl-D-erythritol kinase [Candidatus Omnitrophica bacterium]|nr:4-(cytidine 5'-diphospho)-2-C-methyl-D-erythritol kinase [Candidatus Omnitrophota bacterium]